MKPEDKKEKPVAKKAQPNGRVFDVSRPGKTLAAPTSKPVITGHKPEAQAAQTTVSGIGESQPLLTKRKIQIMPTGDVEVEKVETKTSASPAPKAGTIPVKTGVPVETAGAPAQPTEAEKEALASAALDAVTGAPDIPSEEPGALTHDAKLTIEPPAEAEPKPAEPEPETAAAEPQPAAAPEPEPAPAPQPESKPEESETPAPAEPPEEPVAKATVPLEQSSVPDEPAAGEQPAEGEQAPPEPVIEPLFDDAGHIVVSQHHQRKHHGTKVFLLLLLILLLAAAGLNIALDLELLQLEGVPHTDFL